MIWYNIVKSKRNDTVVIEVTAVIVTSVRVHNEKVSDEIKINIPKLDLGISLEMSYPARELVIILYV